MSRGPVSDGRYGDQLDCPDVTQWDKRAERKSSLIIGLGPILLAAIAIGAGIAWLTKTTLGL